MFSAAIRKHRGLIYLPNAEIEHAAGIRTPGEQDMLNDLSRFNPKEMMIYACNSYSKENFILQIFSGIFMSTNATLLDKLLMVL